jgi:hypothetical protein
MNEAGGPPAAEVLYPRTFEEFERWFDIVGGRHNE